MQSNVHGCTWRASPYIQGRRNRERQHFWGQPQICPFLTFNTLHNNVHWKSAPSDRNSPFSLAPPRWKSAHVIEIECGLYSLVPPPPTRWKSACPSDRTWVAFSLVPPIDEKVPQWSKLGPHFSLVPPPLWKSFRRRCPRIFLFFFLYIMQKQTIANSGVPV